MHTVDNTNIDCSPSYIMSSQQNNSMNFIDLAISIAKNGLRVLNHNMQLDNQNIINNQCVICLEVINEQDQTSILDCLHFFHSKCIAEYKKVSSLCPSCRHEYKNITFNDSLFYNAMLKCKNKDCFYNITLEQAKKINNAIGDNSYKLCKIGQKSMDKIKQIIITDIKSTFIYEDSFTEKIPQLNNCIKKIKFSIKNEDYENLSAFFTNYTNYYSCPYPVSHFYNQETESFLKKNSTIILPIIKKIFISNLKGGEKIIECKFNEDEDKITIIVNNRSFAYANDNNLADGRLLFLYIIDNCIADSLLLKLKIDNPKIFNTSKPSYIKDWNTSENKLNIVNNGEDINIPISNFIDYPNNKLDHYKLKTAINNAQIDYSRLYAPTLDTPADDTPQQLEEHEQRTINFHDLCDLTIRRENNYVTLTYKIILPYPNTQISWNFLLNFNRID